MRPARPGNPAGTGAARAGAADRVAAPAHDRHTNDRRTGGHAANARRTGGHPANGRRTDDSCTGGHAANSRRTQGRCTNGRRTSGSHPHGRQDPHEDQHQEREQYA
ncbi:hypothetical protein [Streptomyces sp. NPDC048508]|uniref:hypothetical protein n=1 Tax=Streptomyces sp. NPDC048508 TaxID=3365561 RepID=UPI00371A3111